VRAVVQRVACASVEVDGAQVASIDAGMLVLVGVARGDSEEDAAYLARKIAGLRIYEDDDGKMNLSLDEVAGEVLAVSQFTLLGDCRKGRRPSFDGSEEPERARRLFEYFVTEVQRQGVRVSTGVFQAEMRVHLVNDGPVTLILDSKREF